MTRKTLYIDALNNGSPALIKGPAEQVDEIERLLDEAIKPKRKPRSKPKTED